MRLINSKIKKAYNNHYKYLVIVVLVFLAAIFSLPKVYSWVQANESKSNNESIPSEDGVKGTKNNPFVILEIVPYEGYAEIGYLIKGCEPVDMDRLRNDGLINNGTITAAATVVQNGEAYTYDHKHEFLKTSLGIEEKDISDYKIMVKTIEPRELINDNLKWIDRADLISISPKPHDEGLLDVWGEFNLAGKKLIDKPKDLDGFANNDLSWEATLKIFEKVHIKEDAAAMILDWTVYTEPPGTTSMEGIESYQIKYDETISTIAKNKFKGNRNNVYKLALMSRTMDPVFFYNLYLAKNRGNTENPTSLIQGGKYILQTGDAQEYWNQYTFMFTQEDGSIAWNKHWDTDDFWNKIQLDYNVKSNVSVRNNIYTYNGDKSLTQDFANEGINSIERYTEEFIKENNGNKNSPSYAVKYILRDSKQNQQRIEKDIKVLDLQPTNDFNLQRLSIRMLFPYLAGKIDIVHMTSAEFVGKIEDLNSTYDLINLGMNCGGYVTREKKDSDNSAWPTGIQLPDYNDDKLDGKIYLHVGDIINRTDSQHKLDWLDPKGNPPNTARMPGNDITERKKDDLIQYIDAGYPVLVDPLLYDTDSDLTKLVVDETTHIYKLIQYCKDEDKYNVMDSSKVTKESVNWNKPRLDLSSSPTPYVGTSADGSAIGDEQYINSRRLEFKYKIISDAPGQPFTVKLYIDANADGRFDEDELNELQENIPANSEEPLTLTKTLAENYFGVIPWKLQIEDTSNRRDEVIGISAIKRASPEKETIEVLQINNNVNSTLNLQESGHFNTYTQNLNDYNINFKTISVKQFEAMFDGITFDPTNPDTNKLNDYNMLVFGFADMYGPITDQDALNNVKHFISQGKSVLFTHDITSFKNREEDESHLFGYYFNKDFRTILGLDRFGARKIKNDNYPYYDTAISPSGNEYTQIHGYTYYALKRIGNEPSTYRHLAFNDDNNETTKARKLNNGPLTQYPYAIDDDILIASTHAQWFQLNLDDPDIVVWYTLAKDNDNKSYIYDLSPNDAANNYYIYSKGNVTYSGVGHSKVGDSEQEVKLFINTMVAAYRAGVSPPTIEITNEEECIFIPGEIYGEEDYLDIKFIPHDYNLKAQKLGVKAYLEKENGDELKIYDKFGKEVPKSFNTKNSGYYYYVKNGETYTAKYKRQWFTNDINNREVTFLIENDEGLPGSEKLKLKERILFNLH